MHTLRGLLLLVVGVTALGTGVARADVLDSSYGGGDIEGGVTLTAIPTGVPGEYLATSISGYFAVGNYGSPEDYRVTGLAPVGSYQGNDNLVFYPGPGGAFDAAGVSWVLENGSLQNVSTYVYEGVVGYELTTDFENLNVGGTYSGSLDQVWFTDETPVAATPEPGTMGLVGSGVLGVVGMVRRRISGGVR